MKPLGSVVCDVFLCFCHFPTPRCGVLCQVWNLIVSISDLCLITYFVGWVFLQVGMKCESKETSYIYDIALLEAKDIVLAAVVSCFL